MATISIITVCFNSARTIADTLASVSAQRDVAREYLVIDGGSTDATLEAIAGQPGVVDQLVSEPDDGIYDAMNKGLDRCSGDIVGILNSDDLYAHERVLQRVGQAFAEDPELDIVYGDLVFVNAEDLNVCERFYNARSWRPWMLRFGWMPPHTATFVRKRLYDRIGGYRTDYRISADYEWFVRAFYSARPKARHLPEVLVHMRMGGVSTAGVGSRLTLNREIVRACRDNGVYTNLALLCIKIPFKLMELVRRPRQPVPGGNIRGDAPG